MLYQMENVELFVIAAIVGLWAWSFWAMATEKMPRYHNGVKVLEIGEPVVVMYRGEYRKMTVDQIAFKPEGVVYSLAVGVNILLVVTGEELNDLQLDSEYQRHTT